MSKRCHLLLSTAVAVFLGLSTAADAQPGHATSSPGTGPTNAELQKEIESLRAEIRQLQQAQKETSTGAQAPTPAQDGTAEGTKGKQGMGMGMGKDCMGMDKGCAAGKDGMGMGKDKPMKPMEPMHQDMDHPMPAPTAPADSMGDM